MRRFTHHRWLTLVCAGVLCTMSIPHGAMAQQSVRSYASREAIQTTGLGITSNSTRSLAVDNDPRTASNITVDIGLAATITQVLDFNPNPAATGTYATTIPANTPITIKFTAPSGLLSLASGITIQAVTNLNRNSLGGVVSYANVGTAVSGASLINLLNGEGQQEITITPAAAYQGIRITLSGGLIGAALGVDIYGAYVLVPASGDIDCHRPIDVLSGVTSNSLANLANGIGSVNAPADAIDGNNNTYAQLNLGTQVLNATYHKTVFSTLSEKGDSVHFVLRDVAGNLLTLGLLTNFRINLYNGSGTTPVKTLDNSSSLLSLTLLQGASDKYVLSAGITDVVFDRAELVFGGVAGVLQNIRIYEVTRSVPAPVPANGATDVYVYAGQSVLLAATPVHSGDLVAWYDAPGGNVIANSVTTTSADAGNTIDVYAAASRNGCHEKSAYAVAHIHVVGFSHQIPANAVLNQPYNSGIAITVNDPLPSPPDMEYTNVSGSLPPGLSLNNGTGGISGTPNATGTYSFAVKVSDQANDLVVDTIPADLIVTAALPADLSPAINIAGLNFVPGASKDFVVYLFETNGVITNADSTITVRVAKLSGWDIKVPGITLSSTNQSGVAGISNLFGGITHSNQQFLFRENAGFIIITSKPGVILPANGSLIIGLNATRKAGTPPNTLQNLTSTIVTGSGGDISSSNNVSITNIAATQ